MATAPASSRDPLRLLDSGPHFELWSGSVASTMRVAWTDRGAVRITIAGHGHGSYAEPSLGRFEKAHRMAKHAAFLIDFWDMHTYDSELRVRWTQYGLKHRTDTLYSVTSQSKLVLMGCTVANLAMGGVVSIHTKRASFDLDCLKHGLPRGTR